ncbi:hypothetical protein F441_12453 [Phytophthora nicotianae CJ01A1]|uniref:Uncharacterized protein n=3 Tax=Phytophthora nicotianae TaxID=4792 RepID=W2Q0D5_PHYN3|nr:hypothetical protein PPTG_23428 [Phytophthora nicotianae INRA-310]ETL35796.1 hypothetical protein L916_12125 [Phytophthora nicotianae]ETN05755.1 hypothetical protein PPTG_23428 [Phytophthora nicotianae INRA-310]ETP12111.1 hypothetical protein F441_12453 [Phytophthora nicotianae CJ01A1]
MIINAFPSGSACFGGILRSEPRGYRVVLVQRWSEPSGRQVEGHKVGGRDKMPTRALMVST